MEARNEALEPGMAASMAPWISLERRKLLDAVEAHGKKAWQRVADDVGSRTATQCERQYRNLKKAGLLEPISEDTPLREGIFMGFGKPAMKKFAKCVAEIDGKRITTVGQLAALDLVDDIEYLMKLTGYASAGAVKQAGPWIEKAEEALAFWQETVPLQDDADDGAMPSFAPEQDADMQDAPPPPPATPPFGAVEATADARGPVTGAPPPRDVAMEVDALRQDVPAAPPPPPATPVPPTVAPGPEALAAADAAALAHVLAGAAAGRVDIEATIRELRAMQR